MNVASEIDIACVIAILLKQEPAEFRRGNHWRIDKQYAVTGDLSGKERWAGADCNRRPLDLTPATKSCDVLDLQMDKCVSTLLIIATGLRALLVLGVSPSID